MEVLTRWPLPIAAAELSNGSALNASALFCVSRMETATTRPLPIPVWLALATCLA